MIYLNKTSSPQQILIPKSREKNGIVVFSLKNTTNLSVLENQSVGVIELNSDLYFRLNIELPVDITIGEYEYSLTDDAGILSTGLLYVSQPSDVEEYNLEIQYEQYEQ